MNVDQLASRIATARWFSRVGSFVDRSGFVSIRSLTAWDNREFSEDVDSFHAGIAAQMDWLPSTRDQADPFGGGPHRVSTDVGSGASVKVMDLYKQTLQSLRQMDKSKLKSGQHDYSEAASGAALYCSRMAAFEVIEERPAVWCELFELYREGYWPCARMPNGDVVVY